MIVLPTVVLEAVAEYRENQEQGRAKAGEKCEERGIVFTNIYGSFLRLMLLLSASIVIEEAELPYMHFQDRSHCAATILLVAGPKVAQELLGHGSITITLDVYSHVLPSMQQEAANKMNEMFK